MYDFEEVKRICQTCTLSGFNAIYESGVSKPFRFLYTSGAATERDQTKTPRFQPQYSLMRVSTDNIDHQSSIWKLTSWIQGETETKVLALASELDRVEACVAKPGFITAPGEILKSIAGTMIQLTVGIPSISVVDLAKVMLDQVINGFEKEPLMPEDLARIAKKA